MTDREQWAMELANTILDEPPHQSGLTPAQCKMLAIVKTASGRCVPYWALAEACCRDEAEPPTKAVINTQLYNIRKRRPDIGASLETVVGMGLRWREAA